jgi:hypothetical protein
MAAAKVETQANSEFGTSDELRIRCGRNLSEVAEARFTTHRYQSSECQLQTAPVAPGADRVREREGFGRALHPDPTKSVRHEAFTKTGVHRSEQQIGVCRPHDLGGALA